MARWDQPLVARHAEIQPASTLPQLEFHPIHFPGRLNSRDPSMQFPVLYAKNCRTNLGSTTPLKSVPWNCTTTPGADFLTLPDAHVKLANLCDRRLTG